MFDDMRRHRHRLVRARNGETASGQLRVIDCVAWCGGAELWTVSLYQQQAVAALCCVASARRCINDAEPIARRLGRLRDCQFDHPRSVSLRYVTPHVQHTVVGNSVTGVVWVSKQIWRAVLGHGLAPKSAMKHICCWRWREKCKCFGSLGPTKPPCPPLGPASGARFDCRTISIEILERDGVYWSSWTLSSLIPHDTWSCGQCILINSSSEGILQKAKILFLVDASCWHFDWHEATMSSFVRRTAARFSSPQRPAASAAAQRKGSDLHPIMEDLGSVGRETDGSQSGGVSTSATFTTDDGETKERDDGGRSTSGADLIQLHDLKGVQHRWAIEPAVLDIS